MPPEEKKDMEQPRHTAYKGCIKHGHNIQNLASNLAVNDEAICNRCGLKASEIRTTEIHYLPNEIQKLIKE